MKLVQIEKNQPVTTSLQVAKVFGKQHKHVIEAIETKIQSAENSAYYEKMFAEGLYKDSRKRNQKLYYLNKDGWTFIAMGFTGKKADEFKLKYIEAFNQMEKSLKGEQLNSLSFREQAMLALAANEETNERVDAIESDITDMKEKQLITTEDKSSIDRMVRNKVYTICKDMRLNNDAKKLLFADLGSSIKQLFNVPHRGRIRAKDFFKVVDFINGWEPNSVTKATINQLNLFEEIA